MAGITKTTTYTAKITLYDESDAKVENPYLDYAELERALRLSGAENSEGTT